jgi:hypothetical protein
MKTAQEHAAEALARAPTGAEDADDITAAHLARIKARMMRYRTDSKRPAPLADKLAAQRKANDAENELRAARRLIFEIEDEVRDQLNNCRREEDSQKFMDS